MFTTANFQAIGMYSPVLNKFIETLEEAEHHFTNDKAMHNLLTERAGYKTQCEHIQAHNDQIDAAIAQLKASQATEQPFTNWNSIVSTFAAERKQFKVQHDADLKQAIADLKKQYAIKFGLGMEDIKLREDWAKAEYKKGNSNTPSPEMQKLLNQKLPSKPYAAYKKDAPWRLFEPKGCTANSTFMPKHILDQDLEARQADFFGYTTAWNLLRTCVLEPIATLNNCDLPHSAAIFGEYCNQANVDPSNMFNVYTFARTQVMPYVVMELSSEDQQKLFGYAALLGGYDFIRDNCWLRTDPNLFSNMTN